MRFALDGNPKNHSSTTVSYRIEARVIRRPWLTFVNALANSILGRFYTARTQLLRALGLWYCKSWGIGENETVKGDSTTQRCFV